MKVYLVVYRCYGNIDPMYVFNNEKSARKEVEKLNSGKKYSVYDYIELDVKACKDL